MIGYWEGEGNVLDSSGNGKDGTWTGAQSYSAGKFGQAIGLNGNSNFVSIDGTSFPKIDASESIFAWIKTSVSST